MNSLPRTIYDRFSSFTFDKTRSEFSLIKGFQPRIFTPTSLLLFVLYFVLSANDGIVKAKSKTLKIPGQPDDFPYDVSSVMFMSCCVSLCTGMFVTVYTEGISEGLKSCLDRRSIAYVLPINALFLVASALKFKALTRLDPDIVSMLSQANLVLLALAARVIMKKRYRRRQYLSLVMISLSMCAYLINRDATNRPVGVALSAGHVNGYCIVLTMCIIETAAMVLAEWFLKGWQRQPAPSSPNREPQPPSQPPLPFHIQKVHVEISGLVLTAVWQWIVMPSFFLTPQQIRHSWLSGWDRWTVAVLIMVVSKAWLAGLVSKLLDSVMKQIGSCLAILLTYVEVIIWIDPAGASPNANTLLCFALVLLSIIMFAYADIQEPRNRKRKPTLPEGQWVRGYQRSRGKSRDFDSSKSRDFDSTAPAMQAFHSIKPMARSHHSELDLVEPHEDSFQRSRRYRNVHKTSSEDPDRHGVDDD